MTQITASPAERLMKDYNKLARNGSLNGGILSYTADGPGEWFTAGTRIVDPAAGVFALPVSPGTSLTRHEAQRCISLAASGLPWEPDQDDEA